MAKIKLGSRPKSFKKTVKFDMLDGTVGTVEMTYKYRTRKDFGIFIDGILEAAGEEKLDIDAKFSMADVMAKTTDKNAEYVLEAAEGWNLDEPFTLDNINQLSNELPAAIAAIMETYRIACTEGRLGN